MVLSVSLSAAQPLIISQITINPEGCVAGESTLEVVASGGQPATGGLYTYDLNGEKQTALIGLFNNVKAGTNTIITVTDDANESVTYTLSSTASSSQGISFSIDSLPMGDNQGCITVSVAEPAGQPVVFTAFIPEQRLAIVNESPFQRTFSAAPSDVVPYAMQIAVQNDCTSGFSFFQITFPFPEGSGTGNYIRSKYCNCVAS